MKNRLLVAALTATLALTGACSRGASNNAQARSYYAHPAPQQAYLTPVTSQPICHPHYGCYPAQYWNTHPYGPVPYAQPGYAYGHAGLTPIAPARVRTYANGHTVITQHHVDAYGQHVITKTHIYHH